MLHARQAEVPPYCVPTPWYTVVVCTDTYLSTTCVFGIFVPLCSMLHRRGYLYYILSSLPLTVGISTLVASLVFGIFVAGVILFAEDFSPNTGVEVPSGRASDEGAGSAEHAIVNVLR